MKRKDVIEFFCVFWKIDKKHVNDNLSLTDRRLSEPNSIRFYQFVAALESNFDVKLMNVHKITTFGDIFRSIK